MDKNVNLVLTELINSGAYAEYAKDSHEIWRATKESQGWSYGPVRDNEKKTNPYLVDFESLPAETRGQNSLTPYAVFNFFRTRFGGNQLSKLETILGATAAGTEPALVEELGEYVHSHFVAAQLSKGETARTRNDLCVYEDLASDTKSWDTQSALGVVTYLLGKVREL